MKKLDSELKSLQFMAKTLAQSAEFFIDKYYDWEDDTPECYTHGREGDIARYQSFKTHLGPDLDALTEVLVHLSMGLLRIEAYLGKEAASRKRKNIIYLKGKGSYETVFEPPQKVATARSPRKI
jgi:hypothetical protein